MRTLSLTPSHPHHILFHPLVEGMVAACHSGDVETLQAMLSEHLELDITLITEGGITPSSEQMGGVLDTHPSLIIEVCYCLLGLILSLSSPDEPSSSMWWWVQMWS